MHLAATAIRLFGSQGTDSPPVRRSTGFAGTGNFGGTVFWRFLVSAFWVQRVRPFLRWPLAPDHFLPVGDYSPVHNGFINLGIVLDAFGVMPRVGTLASVFVFGVRTSAPKEFPLNTFSSLPSLRICVSKT